MGLRMQDLRGVGLQSLDVSEKWARDFMPLV